jgi:hypothetical protein
MYIEFKAVLGKYVVLHVRTSVGQVAYFLIPTKLGFLKIDYKSFNSHFLI